MTHVSPSTPPVPSGSLRQAVRGPEAESAPIRAKRSVETEFGAMLLLAAMPAKIDQPQDGARKASTKSVDQGAAGSGGSQNRPAVALAAHALAQSQADQLRTVGRGVSLSELAQAELRGDARGAHNGPEAKPNASRLRSAEESPRSAAARASEPTTADPRVGSERAVKAVTAPVTGSPMAVPGTAVAAAQRAQVPPSLAAIDRLAAASSRIQGDRAAGGALPVAPVSQGAAYAPAKAHLGRPADSSPPGHASTISSRGLVDVRGALPGRSSLAERSQASSESRPFVPSSGHLAVQVHRALTQALQSRDGSVTIHLTPEHLGQLRVDLARGGEGVSATFEAATPEARRLLESSLPDLRGALEARGLHVDRLDVRLAAGRDAEPPAEDQRHGPSASADESERRDAGEQWGGGAHQDQQRSAPDRGGGTCSLRSDDRGRPQTDGDVQRHRHERFDDSGLGSSTIEVVV